MESINCIPFKCIYFIAYKSDIPNQILSIVMQKHYLIAYYLGNKLDYCK